MTKTLTPPDGKPRLLASTTTALLATRIRSALQTATGLLPPGFRDLRALDILLALHVAEENAEYLDVGELQPVGSMSRQVTGRWVAALEQQGFVDRRGQIIALSTAGHNTVSGLLEAIFVGQRALD